MVRIELPTHLRTLAQVSGEVRLEVAAPVTQRSVLDALETRYPMLRGTIRDHVTQQRRAFLRFFANQEDLSHESPDAALPENVASGKEPLLIIGAVAGGKAGNMSTMATTAIDVRDMTPLLQVFDMPTSIRFYCEVLGFTVAGNDGKPVPNNDWVLLKRDDLYLMLNTAYESDTRPAQPDPAIVRTHRDTSLYFAAPDVDAAYRHLREKGVKAEPPAVAPYGMKQCYFEDPDGYLLCFQWRAEQK